MRQPSATYTERCLEVVESLIHKVRRREHALATSGVQRTSIASTEEDLPTDETSKDSERDASINIEHSESNEAYGNDDDKEDSGFRDDGSGSGSVNGFGNDGGDSGNGAEDEAVANVMPRNN
ncbi:hypothetical protein LOK49_LG10G01410 [Camellia lanceoleosa]|uniref:Uncharacterized protein n=1 Tax=Camellia lanceoleosa TaxID=1840588 RepID=A0ACC0GCQ5_9ERIC|nr:hypothetical protein LOK49_LG10G01410 [Camellia lanceoleosa]